MTVSPQGRRLPSGQDRPWSFPPPWARDWQRTWLTGDLTAGVVVAIMLVPQSLAYAMLAGLPPHAGLLASLLPVLAYAAFGSSAALSVGPTALTSLMAVQSLAAFDQTAPQGSGAYMALAAALALGSGLLLMLMGQLRMGFLSQLLSRPVVQGFTLATAVLVVAGQLAPVLGLPSAGNSLPTMLQFWWMRLWGWWGQADGLRVWAWSGDAVVGVSAIASLWMGPRLIQMVARLGRWPESRTLVVVRLWPLLVLVAASLLAQGLNHQPGWVVSTLGKVSLHADSVSSAVVALGQVPVKAWADLLMPIFLIAVVGFVSSVSVAQTFALKQGVRIDADRELLGLGLANVGSAVLGGMPVTGGLSRSVVNDAAGARSPLAGVITAGMLAAMLLVMLPWLAWLPKAALAAVIIMAVTGLVEFSALRAAWRYDRAEAWAFISTALGVLFIGFESGLLLGMAWSLGSLVWRHSQPHMAEVGRLPGTAHFRNVNRYQVEVLPGVLMVRVDESLDFTNIQCVELRLCELIHARAGIDHVVLLLSAVNHIDHSAVQTLLELNAALRDQGKTLYLAEVKGPVMDRWVACELDKPFDARIFMSAQHAWDALSSRTRSQA